VSGAEVGLGPCFIHGGRFEFDPATVVVAWVAERAGKLAGVEPGDPGARQVQICDECVPKLNAARTALGQPAVETAADYGRRRGSTWPPSRS
jgi:hypothetical protein